MARRFSRCIEDFVCESCGCQVVGNGYTDHCPQCLYSKHVDVNPGDRQSSCLGLMEPIGVESSREGYRITFRCTKCGTIKHNRSAPEDNYEVILSIAERACGGAR